MARRRTPLFLKRQSYRQRRVRDAARLLPLVGAFLVLLPILWAGGSGAGASTAFDGVYLFGVWFGLVVVAGFLAIGLARDAGEDGDAGGDAP